MPYIRKPDQPFSRMRRLLVGYELSASKLAVILNVSEPTARKRLDRPELLTLSDLNKISRFGHIPIEEIRSAI